VVEALAVAVSVFPAEQSRWRVVVPEKPWSQELVNHLMRCMSDLVECADLSDDESDELTAVLFPKLMQNSGLSLAQFRAMVLASCAELRRDVGLEAEPASPLRH
jgi:hypothetical protein